MIDGVVAIIGCLNDDGDGGQFARSFTFICHDFITQYLVAVGDKVLDGGGDAFCV